MSKDNEIRITAHSITGNIKNMSSKVVNLSSCSKQFINVMLTRIPQMPDNVTYLPIMQPVMYSIANSSVKGKLKRTPILVIADSDDYLLDIKIFNLKKFSNYVLIGRIIFMLEKSDGTALAKRGTTRTICNYHHRDKDIIALGCNNANIEDPAQILMVTIIKTPNCVINSIAGLTVSMKYLKVPFMVEIRQIDNYKSWLCMKQSWVITNKDLDKCTSVCMDPPSSKTYWTSLIGYTEYVTTENGPKRIKEANKKDDQLTKILKQIKNILFLLITGDSKTYIQIKQTIVRYIRVIVDLFKREDNEVNKTKNKNKTKKKPK